MNYYIKNWDTMSALGRYLTAVDTMKDEMGMTATFKQNYKGKQNNAALIVGLVTKWEMIELKMKFPYITIVEK